jgi:hypothetical protein
VAVPATKGVFELAIIGLATDLAGSGLDQWQGLDATVAEPAFEMGRARASGGGFKPSAATKATVGINKIDEWFG